MRRRLSLLMALMLIFSALFGNVVIADAHTVDLTVLATSDIHGSLNAWSYENGYSYDNTGYARLHTLVESVKAENPNTLLIDNGDTLQGSITTDDLYNNDLSKPNPMIDLMNYLGYDSMTLGNHEFNFGLGLIDKAVEEADFPILSANTYLKADGSNYVEPYMIKEVDGVKVAVLGLTVPSIWRWDGPKVTSLTFAHMAEDAKKWVKVLKEEEEVDVIIASVHAGLESRHEPDLADAARLVAEYNPEIDVMITGHDHENFIETINGVLVGAPYSARGGVVRMDLTLENVNGMWTVTEKSGVGLSMADYEPDADVEAKVEPYHQATLDFLSEVIGIAANDFVPESEVLGIPEAQIRDTALIDLINAVQLEYTGADVAAAALFSAGSNLPKGDLNYANIFNIYKYPNTLVGIEVTGAQLKEYMEWSAAYYNTYQEGDLTISFDETIRGYNYDMFAGVRYDVDISKPAGERIVNLTFKGMPLRDDQVLKLAVNNYRYGSTLVGNGILDEDQEPYFESDPKSLRAYIKDYISERGVISPVVDDNWKVIGADLSHPLRDKVIQMVNDGELEVPTSQDGRTPNVKSLNVYDLIAQGHITDEEAAELGLTHLVVGHTNDTHARVKEGSYDGMGFAKVATLINEKRAMFDNVLMVDAGDAFHGQTIATLVEGASIVDVMNTIGYDVMTPGNHDFNYGQDRLLELAAMLDFPIISANVVKEDGTGLLDSYYIKDVNGLKVGFFGLSTPETTYKTHPKNVVGLDFTNPVLAARKMVAMLKDEVDLVVAMSHLGVDESSLFTSDLVAKYVDGIDLIVDGHSHTKLEEGMMVNDTLIVQAGEYDKNLGIVDLIFKDGELVYKKAQLITKDQAAETEENQAVLDVIADIEAENNKVTSVIVASTPIELVGERAFVRTGETNLGNLIASAMLDASGADVALTNGGGIRASIDVGEITKGEVITVLPFGNYVVTIDVTGAELRAAIENGITDYPDAKGAFPHIAGFEVYFDETQPAGSRVVKLVKGGMEIMDDAVLTLATNDFLAAGGDNYTMFGDNAIVGNYPALDEVVIAHIAANGVEDAVVDMRISTAKAPATGGSTGTPDPEVPVGEGEVYVVVPGDYLSKIAAKYGVDWKVLAEYNKLANPDLIYPGQKIMIPAS